MDTIIFFFALLTQSLANEATRMCDVQADHMVDRLIHTFYDLATPPVRADLDNTTLGTRHLTILARRGIGGVTSPSSSPLWTDAPLPLRPLRRGRFRSHRLAVTPQVFEPQMPEGTMQAFIGTLGISFAASQVWWNSVIPQKREEVLKSKREGEIKEYIDNLRNTSSQEDSEAFERWLFTDWIRAANKESRVKPAALPFLKKAKWNSGDNPVLVAFGAIMALVISTSVLERGVQEIPR